MYRRFTGRAWLRCAVMLFCLIVACAVSASAASYPTDWMWPIPSSTTLTQGYSSGHTGVDVGASIGDPIYAVQSGTLYRVYTGCNRYGGLSTGTNCRNAGQCNPNHGYNSTEGLAYLYCNYGYGNGICLKTDDGYYVQFAHMRSVASGLSEGQWVAKGTLLGYVGGSGCATGKHCHFAVSTGGEFSGFINPMSITYNNTPVDISVSFTDDTTDQSRRVVNYTDATMASTISVSGASINSVTSVGINLYEDDGTYLLSGSDTPPIPKDGVINAWYVIKAGSSDVNYTLSSGTRYKYRFWAKIGGETYFGDFKYFITLGTRYVRSISFDPTSVTLSPGDTRSILATVGPDYAENKTLSWSSSNTSVATVSSSGTVTAVGVGTATITARSTDGSNISATCAVTVSPVYVSGVALSPATLTLRDHDAAATLSATVSPSNATNKALIWTSSNPAVATVDGNGVVTPKAAGTATITATAADGHGAEGSCAVTVEPGIDSLEFRRYSLKLATEGVGSAYQLAPIVSPANVEYEIGYISSDASVATVTDGGRITAVAPGTAQITATIPYGPEATVIVTVSEMGLVKLPANLERIEAEAFRGDTMERVSMSSSVESIGESAFADNRKLQFALIPNSVTQIAANAFSGCANVCLVCGEGSYAESWAIENHVDYVVDGVLPLVKVKSIRVPNDMTIDVDSELYLTATVLPVTASNKTVTWTSSNTAVATIAGDGALTTRSAGRTTITATATDGSDVSASFVLTVVLPTINVTFAPNAEETWVEADNAGLAADISVAGTELSRVERVGVMLMNAQGTLLAAAEADDPTAVGNAIPCAYDVNEDLSYTLTPNTTYKYRFYAVIYGQTFESDTRSFTTPEGVPTVILPVSELSLAPGQTFTLTPTVKFAESDMVVWTTSKSSVVRVSNGVLTAVSAGTATVTAILAEDTTVRATCVVTVAEEVVDIKVTQIAFNTASVTIAPGSEYQLTVTVLPVNATDRSYTLTSSDPSVATVSQSGLITAVSGGEAAIVATANDGGGASEVCEVRVNAPVTVSYADYAAKQSIGATNAVLAKTISVSGASIDDVTYVGCYVYNAQGSLLGSKREAPKPLNGVINAWYDVAEEIGLSLTAGTTYQYRFVAVVNGEDHYSGYYTFSTEPEAEIVNVNYSANNHQSLGSMNPTVARTISVSGSATIADVSYVGCYLYNANGALLTYKREVPTPLNGVINAWYDMNGELGYTLSAGTTYQYRFVAVVKGKDYYSDLDSFTTPVNTSDVTVTFTANSHQSFGFSNATVARTISVSGASINDVSYVGCYLYDRDYKQLGYKREAPKPLDGVINAWYDVKNELGVSPVPGTLYRYRFVAVVNGEDHYSAYDSFTLSAPTPNTAKIQAVIDRAYAWVNYTWTAPVDIPVYNNVYGNSSYSNFYQKKFYFKAGTVMHGLPYTLAGGCKTNLEEYVALSTANMGREANFSYGGASMWGSYYGADCSELVSDCLYFGDPAIGTSGQTSFSAKAYLYEVVSWDDVQPGDALGISGHTMIVVGVNGSNITTIEQCGNGSNSGALHCPNRTVRPEGGYYVCGTCKYCMGSKKGATVLRTRTKNQLSSYTVYRYLPLYQ